jgi:hypothetical protein
MDTTTPTTAAGQLAPTMLPHKHERTPLPMHFRAWRWAAGMTRTGLTPGGVFEGAAWVRLDYITARPPYAAGDTPPPMRAVGAHVAIAGPVANHDALAAVWAGALTTPIAIEMWSKDHIHSQSSLHLGGRTHVYAVLPLLRADRDAQQQEPTFTDPRGRRHPAYRFRAEVGNAWGHGPLPIRYDGTRHPARLPYPLPTNHMWHVSTTELHPTRALAYSTTDPEQVHHVDQ